MRAHPNARPFARLAGLLSACAALVACSGNDKVVRVYDGTIVAGRFIGPDGYAHFLRGAIAEASGDLGAALGFYERAADDGDDPLVWARIGELRCRRDPGGRGAGEAFAKARKADDGYAGALAAEARCEATRGHRERAEALTREAAAADPRNVDWVAQAVSLERRSSSEARARAVALTREHGERDVAWDALAAWARAHRDAPLFAEAIRGLLPTAPTRSPEIEAGAVALLGEGHRRLATAVAVAVADAPRELLVRGPRDPVVARLAVDDALVRGDRSRAEQRAARGHVALSELAGRAALLGQDALARALAARVLAADPSSSAAELVLATEIPRPGGAPFVARSDLPSLACVLAFTRRLAEVNGAEAARAFFEAMPHGALLAHDPLVNEALVDLAARGVVPDRVLPLQAAIELSARRRSAPPALSGDVDPVHRLLWMALVEPRDGAAVAEASRLAPAVDDDARVAFSLAAIARSRGGADAASVVERLARATAAFPSDPLLLALRVETTGEEGAADARTRLMAVARTDAERALARH